MIVPPCKICESPYRTRIEGWILSGMGMRTICNWCHELDPPCTAQPHDIDDHIDGGHFRINETNTLAMLVKFNREAEEIIEESRPKQVGDTMRRSGALNQALITRARTIELIAKVGGVLETGPRSLHQNVTVMLPKDVQKQMLETAMQQLEGKPSERIESTAGKPDSEPDSQ